MKIMTKDNYNYEGQGTSIAFPLCLYHKSVWAEERTMKLCMFLKDTDDIIEQDQVGRITQNMRIRRQSDKIKN